MYETNYRGIRYCFKEDCLILNDKVIDYRQISNIRHRGGQDPAFIFEYSGRQFAMPYPPEELGAILPYMKKASMISRRKDFVKFIALCLEICMTGQGSTESSTLKNGKSCLPDAAFGTAMMRIFPAT